jgi:putative DNA primase/helicase
VIISGRRVPRMAAAERDEEWRKRIMSIAIAGDPVVLLDNLPGVLGSPALDMALTSGSITDRVLGVSENATVRLQAVWFATGNNVQVKGDLFRRTLHIRLESKHEKPEERSDFRTPSCSSTFCASARLLRAALTILRAYFEAGLPDQGLRPWGSFEAWSRLIRHTIVWLGLEDPWTTREHLAKTADTEHDLLSQLLSAWEEFAGDGRSRCGPSSRGSRRRPSLPG